MTSDRRITWQAVRDEIAARIANTVYAPGDRLPRDEDLAEALGCARSTVVRAMQDLADNGIVVRRRKGGTHVPLAPVTRATFDIPVTRVEIETLGQDYGYRLLSQREAPIPEPIMTGFGLPAPEHMLQVKALHLADQQPYIFEDRWISTRTVPEIQAVDLSRLSANEWLVRHRPYSRCAVRFYAISAGTELGAVFDTDPATPLFVIERSTWIDANPITSVRAISHPGYQMVTQTG